MKNLYLTIKNKLNGKDKLNKGNKMGTVSVQNNLLYIKNQLAPQIAEAVDANGNAVHKYSEGKNTCDYIITHYTASTNAQSAHQEYQDPTVQLSWHLTVDRDGNVFQLLPFDKIAWHAGVSSWMTGPNKITDLNGYSIGIEHSNAGPLLAKGAQYETWSGQTVPPEDVFTDADGNAWQAYTPAQLAASKYLIVELAKIFQVHDILSHEMIAQPLGRKKDTGPAYAATLADIRQTYKSQVPSLGKSKK